MAEKTRLQLAEELRSEGLTITVENSIIICITDDPELTFDSFTDKLNNKGYHGSYGMRLKGLASEQNRKPVKGSKEIKSKEPDRKPAPVKKAEEKIEYKENETGQLSLF